MNIKTWVQLWRNPYGNNLKKRVMNSYEKKACYLIESLKSNTCPFDNNLEIIFIKIYIKY